MRLRACSLLKKGMVIIMRICICDDDKNICDSIKVMLEKNAFHHITVYNSAEELLFECEDKFPFDVIFLDVQMKQMNGIDCARRIRQYDKKVAIIFLTMIADYVFEGYEVNAVRYLLKPLQEAKCMELLELIRESLQKEHHYLYINKTKLDCEEILYIESYGHYCTIHANEEFEVKTSLAELYEGLPDEFIQTHRSYIVNLEHVESIIKEGCLLSNNTVIPISRSSYKKVNMAFMEYIKSGTVLPDREN